MICIVSWLLSLDIIALTLLKSGLTARARYREITCKTYASGARLNMQGAMIIQVSVFTWLEFHFIRENAKITEIPPASTIRITFRYNKRDDLHTKLHISLEQPRLWSTRASICKAYMTTSDAVCHKNRSFLVVGFQESAEPLRSTFDRSFVTNVFHCSLCIGLLNKVLQDLTLTALTTSLTMKQMHTDWLASVPLMAILCWAGEVGRKVSNRKKKISTVIRKTKWMKYIFVAMETRCTFRQ